MIEPKEIAENYSSYTSYASYATSTTNPLNTVLSEDISNLPDLVQLLTTCFYDKLICSDFNDDLLFFINKTNAYCKKNEAACEYIAKRFPPPQITYNRFAGALSAYEKTFIGLVCKGTEIISIATKRTEKRDALLASIKENINALSEKLTELLSQLIKNHTDTACDDNSGAEAEALVKELQRLTLH